MSGLNEAQKAEGPEQKPKRKSIWHIEGKDTSPVSRLRFTELEWKAILEAVGFQADYLVNHEYPIHKEIWLNQEHFAAHETNPNSELGQEWTKHTDMVQDIKNQVVTLNGIERQLQLHFKIIDGSVPEFWRTVKRVMH